jgi:hypothetical protein
MGQGTVAKTYSLVSTDPSATRIDCRWRDAVPYDAAAVPASGNVMFEVQKGGGGGGLGSMLTRWASFVECVW